MHFARSATGRWSSFFSSIRFRLTLWFVIILSIVLGIFSLFIYASQSRDLRLDAVQRMQTKLDRLEAYFRSDAWQDSDLPPGNVPTIDEQTVVQPGDFILLSTADAQVLQNWGSIPQNLDSLVSGLVSAVGQAHNSTVYEQTVSVTDGSNSTRARSYLLLTVPILRHDAVVGFLILGSPSTLADQLRRLQLSLLFGSLGMLVIAFLGGIWLADRAMRPVSSITETARTISESDLSRRLNMQGRDELAQLAGTFDSMLSRLQKAFERQRQFVADASHELRTPLTIINLEVGRVLSGVRNQNDYRHALQVVNLESSRMTRLVNDLMTLARMDSGQTILQLRNTDLSEAALEAYERMSGLAEREEISLDVGEMLELRVRGDQQYLVQMISNLIENAIKYTPRGGRVRIETSLGGEPRSAVLRVSDTGPGIPAEHLPHLFERFYRVDASRARDSEDDLGSPTGTGLGLSIVSWIVRSHGGQVGVLSTPGQGATFEVSLPLLPT
jgi:heavy metal sensor kinase